MGCQFFDFLKLPKCVLSNPQTTTLAFIGSQLMHYFESNSPQGARGVGMVNRVEIVLPVLH